MIKKGFAYFVLLMLMTVSLFGCGKVEEVQVDTGAVDQEQSEKQDVGQPSILLKVTKDCGEEALFEQELNFKEGETLCDAMQAVEVLSPKWKGSFTHEIMGIKKDNGGIGGERKAWFFHVNGLVSDACAPGVELRDGDVIWYDYHAWKSMNSANSALIGCYPEPFVHGFGGEFNPTIIMTLDKNQKQAEALKESMLAMGISKVEIQTLDNSHIQDRVGPTVVLAEWNDIRDFEYIKVLNDAYKKTGLNVRFTDEGVELHQYDGEKVKTISEKAGVIVATGSGAGDRNALWLVVGTDSEGLSKTVDVLANEPKKIKNMYGAAIVSDEVIRLPIQ